MEINTTTSPQNLNGPTTATAVANSVSSDFETFLKMLTVQLENQDPLSPVKSEEFAVQLATFSGVEQQVLTNDLLKSLQSQMAVSGMAQFAGWVGMEARAPVAARYEGEPITLAPKPDMTSSNAVLLAKNEFGTVVQTTPIDLSNDLIQWSGQIDGSQASDGLYTFEIQNIQNGTVTSTSPVEVYTQILEARNSNGKTMLITDGGVEVEANDISALRNSP